MYEEKERTPHEFESIVFDITRHGDERIIHLYNHDHIEIIFNELQLIILTYITEIRIVIISTVFVLLLYIW